MQTFQHFYEIRRHTHSLSGVVQGNLRLAPWRGWRNHRAPWLFHWYATVCVINRAFLYGAHPFLTGAKRREFSGMIHWLTINNHPSNPQQPIHSLRLAPVSFVCFTFVARSQPLSKKDTHGQCVPATEAC